MNTLLSVVAIMVALVVFGIVLWGIGQFREAHDRILEGERIEAFYDRLEKQELGKAEEAWRRGDIKVYEFHRSAYNSLVAQHNEERNKTKGNR